MRSPLPQRQQHQVNVRDRVCRRILMAKGKVVPLRIVQQSFAGSLKAPDVEQAMERLNEEGLGLILIDNKTTARYFQKCPPADVWRNPNSAKYCLDFIRYAEQYSYVTNS